MKTIRKSIILSCLTLFFVGSALSTYARPFIGKETVELFDCGPDPSGSNFTLCETSTYFLWIKISSEQHSCPCD